jgi:SAM-dependent methyltransferase
MGALLRQLGSYAEGHLAALFVQYSRSRNPGELRRAFVRLPRYYGRRVRRSWQDPLLRSELKGYRRGLRHWRFALHRYPPPAIEPGEARPADRSSFLAANPFPRPLTEGLYYREKMKAIHRVVPDAPVREVLEIGGGRSGLASKLFPGAAIVNLDLDPIYGHDRTVGAPFVAGDATQLPFPDGAFDVVTLFDVLEHIPDDRAAAQEALRVLKPGGWVLATSPNERWRFPYYAPLRRFCPSEQDVMDEWGHVRRGYRLDDMDDLFGLRHEASATFINPVSVVNHDVAFSNLPVRVKRAALWATAPITWSAAWCHRADDPGTETAAAWQAPKGSR